VLFVVSCGLDWVASVPPTVALAREVFGTDGPIVFGWIFAAHQIGAAIAATTAGVVRDSFGSYTAAWLGAAGLCAIAAIVSGSITRRKRVELRTGAMAIASQSRDARADEAVLRRSPTSDILNQ
jgi:predicted MFS family arabinose efflux permease